MGLVDDRVLPGNLQSSIVPPGKSRVYNNRLQHRFGVIAGIYFIMAGSADAVAEMCIRPFETPRQSLGIRVNQQLIGIEAVTVLRLVGPMNTIAIELTRRDVAQIAMPY